MMIKESHQLTQWRHPHGVPKDIWKKEKMKRFNVVNQYKKL